MLPPSCYRPDWTFQRERERLGRKAMRSELVLSAWELPQDMCLCFSSLKTGWCGTNPPSRAACGTCLWQSRCCQQLPLPSLSHSTFGVCRCWSNQCRAWEAQTPLLTGRAAFLLGKTNVWLGCGGPRANHNYVGASRLQGRDTLITSS